MKKFLSIILACIIATSTVSCTIEKENIVVNVENQETLQNTVLGVDALVEIGNYLYYDSTTRIVYWWNNSLSYSQYATTPSPYYAPNGLPYRYNPETNTFEEIKTR